MASRMHSIYGAFERARPILQNISWGPGRGGHGYRAMGAQSSEFQLPFFSETVFRTDSVLIAIDAVQRDLKTSAGSPVAKSIFWDRGAPKHYNGLKLWRALA